MTTFISSSTKKIFSHLKHKSTSVLFQETHAFCLYYILLLSVMYTDINTVCQPHPAFPIENEIKDGLTSWLF